MERLSQDFPDRLVYRRELARTLSNLSSVLLSQSRPAEAESILRRAVNLNTEITAKFPEDVQIQFELAKDQIASASCSCRRERHGRPRHRCSVRARSTNAWSKNSPTSLVIATSWQAPSPAWPRCRPYRSSRIRKRRSAPPLRFTLSWSPTIPTMPSIGSDRRLCLRDQAAVVAERRPEQAEAIYRQALATLDSRDARDQTSECLRIKVGILNNLGCLQLAGAEEALLRSIAVSESLVSSKSSDREARHNLAIAQNNLGELLMKLGRLREAGKRFKEAVANFERLLAEAPQSIDLQSQLGTVLMMQGKWLDQNGKSAEARSAMERAVTHRRRAVQLSKNGPAFRELLGGHLLELAEVTLKLGAYDEATRIAPGGVQDRTQLRPRSGMPRHRADLARLVARVGGDAKLNPADRDRLTRNMSAARSCSYVRRSTLIHG